ncbi:MAG: nodulation protein NfeD [Deltaproteobacteria bacterium]|nr:nodulation protein NfeD [Deltaproteobacteria bacterium]
MKNFLCVLILAAGFLFLPVSAFSDESVAYHIEIDGVINPVAMDFIKKAILKTEKEQAECLILELDTPGGLGESMREIVKAMLSATIPVIVYVAPNGARAASAGVFITLAAHVAAMAPGTHIGAAHPVKAGGGSMGKEMARKVENDFAAYIRSLAGQHGRNAEWAEKAVRESVSITASAALKLNVIDLIAKDLPDLLTKIDGRKITVNGKPYTLDTRGIKVREIHRGMRYHILDTLSNPNVAYILMILGFYGLFFEIANPGAILPGVVGGISLILAFYAFQSLPINYAGLLLILLALILFVAEALVISHGVLAIGGIVAMTLGSFMLIESPLPFLRISLSVILPTVALTALFFLMIVGLAVKVHRKKHASGPEALIGETGKAETDLDPEGTVFLHSELWQAVAFERIEKGTNIEVTGLQGLVLKVRRKEP